MTWTAQSVDVDALRQRIELLRAEKLRRLEARTRDLRREKALRYETAGAFAAFVKLVWPVVEPKPLEWAPYMGVVCHALHRQMLGDPEYRKLLINLPPGFAKSLLVSVLAPAYEWLFNPGRRKLFFSASDNVAIRDSRRTRILITSDVYRDLMEESCQRLGLKKWTLAFDQNQKANFENDHRGFRQCLTVDSRVIGSRGDDLVIDDPVDVKEVIRGNPDAIDRRLHETSSTIDQVLDTRVNDRRDARRTLVMQRLHPADPAGMAIGEGGWRVICLPLRYDPEHPQACPEDPRTTPGELLHPRFLPEAEAAELERKLGAQQAAGQLQQLPVAKTGGKIEASWFTQRYTCRPEDIATAADEVWITVDSNVKGGAGHDDTAIQTWALKGGLRYLLSRIARPMSPIEHDQTIDDEIAHWLAHIRARPRSGVLIEDAANGAQYLQTRRSRYPFLVAFSPGQTPGKDKSKAARADYFIRAAESSAVVLPDSSVCPWVGGFVERLVGWPMVGRDEMDAASQLHMRWTVGEDEMPVVVHSGFVDARNRFAR